MPKISMIAAMANGRIIGADNAMPWHLPADLKHFKKITMGKPVVMGRKTYQSIGRALPNRKNIVISRSQFSCDDASVVPSIDEALQMAQQVLEQASTIENEQREIMIIGGGAIYEQCLPLAERLYLTFIDLDIKGDTEFPDYEQAAEWVTINKMHHTSDANNPFNYQFVTLERRSTKLTDP